ncbi:Squalene-hopene cyclase C-terminal domain-containing protein [Granulicella rosea]|uniref:Squalene-hopene cyclase C-terminal domain-containing protein n=1 Tax=Granulicella rosea TaxID=474952 RepID=A0A239JMV8_9BACT|nr:ankyrin repeat domain-containing protein [Granulicella rosea]SNT06778.1 Squalene-hopene cyclase C-terminal domain-containing protein [Granulicella rosea]
MKKRFELTSVLSLSTVLALGLASCWSRFVTPASARSASEQTTEKIDFAHDIQPILRQNCVRCHGATKQSGGMRLDRKSSAMKAFTRRVVPGNSANSMLFHRVSDSQFGPPMPPDKPLTAEQVDLLRRWIDQGADWPDSLSNEAEPKPLNPDAIAAVDLLRDNQLPAFLKLVSATPALLNARGPEGSTPFMYAVLYTGAATLDQLLKLGADPNLRNDEDATALMWAAHEFDKTAVLVAHGADVNARSADFRTPLMIAARRPGAVATVKLLLDHGADPNRNERPGGQSSALLEAATAGDAASFELLLDRGAKLRGDAEPILVMNIIMECRRCVDLTVAKLDGLKAADKTFEDKGIYTSTLQDTAFLDDAASIRLLLAHGADPKLPDGSGRTALLYAAASDVLSLDAIKLLVAGGSDVNAHSLHEHSGDSGMTVLDMAMQHGHTPIVDYLVSIGAKPGQPHAAVLPARFTSELRPAVQSSLPLLQRADANFAKNSGCVSCHNNNLTAMTMSLARKQGFAVDEQTAASQLHVNADALAKARDILHQGFLLPVEDNFSENVMAYILLGLDAEGYKPNLDTDAAAMHILWRQKPNGEWQQPHGDGRQPLCLNYTGQTALSLRGLQLYAPKTDAAVYRKSIALGAAWLATAKSYNNDDRSWRVSGLAWAGTNKPALLRAVQELKSAQKPDGGWSDLPSMDSSAYATGKSLVALHTAGMAVSDPAYQRGMKWLLSHQQPDGSWYVQTRALGFQPWSDAGFPHKYDQFISAAATNWAAMALTLALPEKRPVMASLR